LAATSGFVFKTRLALKEVTTTKTDDRCDSFQNFQILGGRDSPQGFSGDQNAILESLAAAGFKQ